MTNIETGDTIRVQGHEYEVKQVDMSVADDRVIQYRLESLGPSPPARLKPHEDDEYEFVFVTYDAVTEDQVTVVEEDEDD